MTLVVGTAGHIDHGKTTLLRALTGIDADRLPEERRRGLTIDVGYAHLALDDGATIDFVDVPGHDRLVGNMLVGAGEVDAVMLVVAADDGPMAQTLEHLALLDALGIAAGIAVVTKVDAVDAERTRTVIAEVDHLLSSTSLAGSPVLPASGQTGEGIDNVRMALMAVRDRLDAGGRPDRPPSLAIDRVFTVRGRGAVVTGTLRGGPLARGDSLQLVPGQREVRVRELQVHGRPVDRLERGGRTALNLAGIDAAELQRGMVVTHDPEVVATDRVLATFRSTVADRSRWRLHAGTAAVDAAVGRSGHDALTLPDGTAAGVLRLAASVALRPGDRFVLRRGASVPPVGGVVVDTSPPRGVSRRRQTPQRVAALAAAVAALAPTGDRRAARLDLHGAIDRDLAPDVAAAAADVVAALLDPEAGLAAVRSALATSLRRTVSLRREDAASAAGAVIDSLVADGRLVRDGDRLRRPGAAVDRTDASIEAAKDRLEAALAVVAPPPLAEAARAAGCPPSAVRDLERTARIVVLEPDLAYAMTTYRDLAARALAMAARSPLTPAAFRDATGTSRKYVMAILEDLDRRAILRRTPDGHVPGPRAPAGVGR
jgi:selenocysteine-specific elongation factor